MNFILHMLYLLTTSKETRLTHKIQDRAAADLEKHFGEDVTR